MPLPTKAKWVAFGAVISVASMVAGYWFGVTRAHQTQYKLLALQLNSSLRQLQALHQDNTSGLKYSLEVSAALGVNLLPTDQSFLTNRTRAAVKEGLENAKCYEEKYGWKSVSPELRDQLNKVLKDVEPASCEDL